MHKGCSGVEMGCYLIKLALLIFASYFPNICVSQQSRIIHRQTGCVSVLRKVFGVNEDSRADAARKLFAKGVNRLVRLVSRRFHFNRHYLVALREQKVDLIIAVAARNREGVIKKSVALRIKHLCHKVFVQVSEVGIQLI